MLNLDFNKLNGLIPVITVDYNNNDVLMLAYMNEEALNKTLETGKVHYFSRSRNKIWLKGETSGNFQILKEIYVDCDNDTLLIKVEQIGPACHEGYRSCFFRKLENDKLIIIREKMKEPEEMYGKTYHDREKNCKIKLDDKEKIFRK